MTITRFLDKSLGGLVEAAGNLAAFACLVLVCLVAGNVLMRYVFSAGTVGLQELEWHLISPIALFGMVYGMRYDGHVRVDVVFERMSPLWQGIVDFIAMALLVCVAVICVKLSIPFAEYAHRLNEGSPDPGGLPYRYLLKAFIPIGFALLAIQGLLGCLKAAEKIRRARSGGLPPDDLEPAHSA